jgi:hypothetical protein
MAADPQRQEAPSNDLFGRWLAHHEQQSADQVESTGSSQGTPETPATPRTSRRLPTAAVASSAVERDPMIGSRIVPPSTFGSRRPAANTPQRSGPVNELDREPAGWEPIVMRSVRSRTEKAEAKKVSKPIDRPGRLQRLKARLVDPAPEAPAETTAEEEVPAAPALPAPPLPTRTPTPAPVTTRSIEETIAASLHPTEKPVSRHAQPVERVERAVERVERAGAEPVAMPVAEPVAEPVAQPVAEPVAEPVARVLVPEEVAAPRPVRAFIEAPRLTDPEPVVAPEPEPFSFLPGPAPALELVTLQSVAAPVRGAKHVRVEPVAVEPLVVEPLVVEPLVVEPVVIEPVVIKPVVIKPPPVAVEPVVEPIVEPEPEPEPEVVLAPEPEQEPVVVVPEPVVARVTEIEPEPIEPQDLPESVSSDEPEEPAARRSFLPRSLRQLREDKPAKEQKEPRTPRASGGDAARDLVAAKARARATAPAPVVEPEPEPVPAAVTVAEATQAPEPEPAPAPAKASKHDEVATQMPGVYRFTPKRTVRRMLTIAMLIGVVITAYFVQGAIQIRDTPSIGLGAIAVLATATVWAIRAGASVTKLEVHQGQLEVTQQGGRFVFDLASQYTKVEVLGEPGRRGWRVLFPRRGMAPFAVDASMVDPDDFMRVLRFFRPQLVNH